MIIFIAIRVDDQMQRRVHVNSVAVCAGLQTSYFTFINCKSNSELSKVLDLLTMLSIQKAKEAYMKGM